jgi:hypothetical protein
LTSKLNVKANAFGWAAPWKNESLVTTPKPRGSRQSEIRN